MKLKINGDWIEDAQSIKEAVKSHFETLYQEESFNRPVMDGVHFKQISADDNSLLIAPFSIDDKRKWYGSEMAIRAWDQMVSISTSSRVVGILLIRK